METLSLRALAVVAWILAAAAVGLVRPGDPPRRAASKVALGAALAYVGWRGWRRPSGTVPRLRRRVRRLLAVMSSPDLQVEFLESSPAVPLAGAVAADWARATRDAELLARAFSARERDAVAAVTRALAEPIPDDADLGVLRGDPAWQRVESAARAALATFEPR